MKKFESDVLVSSRAPVWGASQSYELKPDKVQFQVVPPCGGHHAVSASLAECFVFQVVPPGGGHQNLGANLDRDEGFKSCPRVGGI